MRLPTYQDLSKEQDEINNLPLKGRWLVTGPPGTGKTVMALYRSKMITDRKKQAVLLMWGRLLSDYTRQAVEELGITGVVHSFTSWWSDFCWKQWRERPQLEPYVFDWHAIIDLYRNKPFGKDVIPYLLVDEGQDLPKTFFVFTRDLATQLTVFADENQRITQHNSTLDEIRGAIKADGEFSLTRNYRNTREIAEVAAHFYSDVETGLPKPPTRSGPPVELRPFPYTSAATEQIANLATTNRHQQIGVFVPTKRLVRKYVNSLKARNVAAQWYSTVKKGQERPPPVNFSAAGVTVTTWASAKGLEFDTVFVAELQANWIDLDDPTLRMQLYVLASRARERLYFSYTGSGRPAILPLLPDGLVTP